MRILCVYSNTDESAVRCRVQEGPGPAPALDKEGWALRFTATCSSAGTADVLLQFLEWRFSQNVEAHGLIRAPYSEVRRHLVEFIKYMEAREPVPAPSEHLHAATTRARVGHGLLLRVTAGALALALFTASIWLQLLVIFFYPIVIVMRRNTSSLYTVAETAYIFTVLDWRNAIHMLGRVALGQMRLWPAK